jgi:hypothetical protein
MNSVRKTALLAMLAVLLAFVVPVMTSADAAECSPRPGVWTWFRGGDVAFRPDGTLHRKKLEAHWTCSNNVLVIHWLIGYVDTLILSPDRRSLQGFNENNAQVWGNYRSAP